MRWCDNFIGVIGDTLKKRGSASKSEQIRFLNELRTKFEMSALRRCESSLRDGGMEGRVLCLTRFSECAAILAEVF